MFDFVLDTQFVFGELGTTFLKCVIEVNHMLQRAKNVYIPIRST
jgi:hypothetical protein